ncbi:aldehyde ferredoxin oxidoreductase [Candidatus Woesearchaeota archaeon]|nr:aldehyde ferredoxin oxidoreductase [Candidatus Woesearchaeota archaeon]
MIPQKELIVDMASGQWEVKDIQDPGIIGPIDYGFRKKGQDVITFGAGVLAGSAIPGTNRLFVTAISPIWTSFYISTMGGAALLFVRLGINYLRIRGKAASPTLLRLKSREGKLEAELVGIPDVEGIWKGYAGMQGYYALQRWVYDMQKGWYGGLPFRILATGPSATRTPIGAIGSAPVAGDGPTAVDCWAGRGGMGSAMAQRNNLFAVCYGGDAAPAEPALRDRTRIDAVFMRKLHNTMAKEDMDDTKKYRYDPLFHSGGTFGVNYTKLKGWMFSFNYQSVNWTEEERVRLHADLVLGHYLKQFNEETIERKQSRDCGEPCTAFCKKMNGPYKKDYEPYQVFGPNAGIFDQRAAEKANHHADMMGLDAIQSGGLVIWIMELLDAGIIRPGDYGLMRVPRWDLKSFDVVNDSMHNAELATEILDMVLYTEKGEAFRHGIRRAAKALGPEAGKRAVYTAFGDEGCMVPNQYWVPGMFSPMPIMGKYFEYYGAELWEPYEIGTKNVERMQKEVAIDNMGICRFHRGWAEKILHDLLSELWKDRYDPSFDFDGHHKRLVQEINLANRPIFWESERIVGIIHGFLRKFEECGTADQTLKGWLAKFEKDRQAAAREYWDLLLKGINDGMR